MSELRVIVFSVDIGSGHKMAGEAVIAALERHGPVTAKWVECLDYIGSDGGQFGRDAYFKALERAPGLWGAIYEEREAYKFFRPFSEFVDGLRVGTLEPDVSVFRPDLMIAVHPFGCGFGAALKKWGITAPVAAILTDFDGHPGWIANGVDRYFCATPALTSRLLREGLPTGLAVATGIPLRPAFWSDAPRAQTRRQLGLPNDVPIVLLLGGGLGLGPIEAAARALTSQPSPCQVVLIAGNNEELERAARALAKDSHHSLHVCGMVSNMQDYMGAADLAVGKPGGLTSSELLSLGVPLICLDPIPGQEESNAAQLSNAGAGQVARDANDAARLVSGLLNNPERLRAMSDAAWALGKPDAAITVAEKLVELRDEGPCTLRPPTVVRIANDVERELGRAAESVGRGLDTAIDSAEDLAKDAGRALNDLFGKFKF